MKYLEKIDLTNKINFLAVQSFLINTNWTRVQSKKDNISIFQKQIGNNFFEIILPLSRDFSDYPQAMLSALKTIGKVENKDEIQLLNDLLLPPSDVVRFRIINNDTKEGSISFEDGFNLFENARKALYAIACDIVQPEVYHKRLSFKLPNGFIDKCRLGQTERGSFIASIICPFIKEEGIEFSQLNLFASQSDYINSFTRKVTNQLIKSLSLLKKSIENSDTQKIIEAQSEIIISANFLESIVEMSELDEDSELEITSTFAPIAPSNLTIPNRISFSKDYIPAIKNIIEKQTPAYIEEYGEFTGKISQTKADADPSKRVEGEVIFNFLEDDKAIKARVLLDSANYSEACKAHDNGKNVLIKGILKTKGKLRLIENPQFQVL